jgi:hypothetical protein
VLVRLAVPFVDTRASALSWWLGDDAPRALDVLVLTGAAGTLELRLLGASHHVVASTAGARCPEVVACGPSGSGLPGQHDGEVAGARYRFRSTTAAYAPAGLARVARDLRRRAAGSPRALVGVFPGDPHALTVLTGRELARGWAWSSWHVYPHVRPGVGEVVRTRSSLVAPS